MKMLSAAARGSLITLMLSGCATVPVMEEAQNTSGKRFEPIPERGVLYVYRESPFGLAVTLPTSLDGRLIGPLGSDTWYRMEVTPGRHDIACHAGNTGTTAVDVAAGEVRFVEIAIQMGFMQPQCRVFVPTDEVGRKSVLGGKRLRPAFDGT